MLSNFQEDFLLDFQPDVDFVYYEDMGDAVEKARFYLQHDAERIQIAKNGLNQIQEHHTYEIRLAQMLEVVRF